MLRKIFLILISVGFISGQGVAQSFVKTSDLFKRTDGSYTNGELNINQNPAVDSLLSRYILANSNLIKDKGPGMRGYRIQIYRSSVRNARDESSKVDADFISKFQNRFSDQHIPSYILYDKPGWYMVRVGDFRSRTEAMKLFLIISKEFKDAYIVPDFIKFPDQNKK